jgi:hypothetical protein
VAKPIGREEIMAGQFVRVVCAAAIFTLGVLTTADAERSQDNGKTYEDNWYGPGWYTSWASMMGLQFGAGGPYSDENQCANALTNKELDKIGFECRYYSAKPDLLMGVEVGK